jgi:hypothetical protein
MQQPRPQVSIQPGSGQRADNGDDHYRDATVKPVDGGGVLAGFLWREYLVPIMEPADIGFGSPGRRQRIARLT